MVHLTAEELRPYEGGWLEIKKVNAYDFRGGIKTLSIIDNTLKIKFVWKVRFEDWPSKNPRWIHVPEFTEYIINLDECAVPGWHKVEQKTIFLYSDTTYEQATFHMANSVNHIKPLDVEGCPAQLELELQKTKEQFLSMLDLNKIPRVNFSVDQISTEKNCKFVRIDLKWKSAIWSFIRIQDNSEDNHILIYYVLINEIAERFMLESYDIESLLFDRGGGYLCLKENSLRVFGLSSCFHGEPNHELTRSVLREELLCQAS